MFEMDRRNFLYGLGSSLGALAFTDLLKAETPLPGPLAVKAPMHAAKAKACIMLFMEGGPSQVDTFDPKPKLNALHVTESKRTAGLATGKRFYVGSPFKSRRVGNAGIEMTEPHMQLPAHTFNDWYLGITEGQDRKRKKSKKSTQTI